MSNNRLNWGEGVNSKNCAYLILCIGYSLFNFQSRIIGCVSCWIGVRISLSIDSHLNLVSRNIVFVCRYRTIFIYSQHNVLVRIKSKKSNIDIKMLYNSVNIVL